MTFIQGLIVIVAVGGSLYMVVRQFIRPFSKAKGSCRACGEVCECEQTKRRNDGSATG